MIQRAYQYLSRPGLGPLLVKAVIGSAGLRFAGIFFGFLVGVQLARGLGVEGYGIYGLAMSIIALLTVPIEIGLPQLLTREVAVAELTGNRGRLRGILRWANRTAIFTTITIVILVAASLAATQEDLASPLSMTLLAGLLMAPLVAFSNLRAATLRGFHHIVKGQLPDTLVRPASFSILLFIVSLLSIPLSPAFAMGLGAVSAAVALVVGATMLRSALPSEIRVAAAETQSRDWWASTLPMALSEGMRVLQGHLVILLLGFMATASMVGVFRAASSVYLLIAVPFTLLNIVGAPIIARLHAQGDRARSQRLMSWIALGIVGTTILLTLPFVVAGEMLLSMVFGVGFGDANAPLLVLCASAIINGFFGASTTLLNMTGHHARVTRASGISLATLAVTSPPLINYFGVMGAASAAALSLILVNALAWRDALNLLGLDTSVIKLLRPTQERA
jgi:O-antigen/teichoic acid export membrane protein